MTTSCRKRLLSLSVLSFVFQFSMTQQPFQAQPLTETGDLSALMVEGIDSFLAQETNSVAAASFAQWQLKFDDSALFNRSIAKHRMQLSKMLGIVDSRVKPNPQLLNGANLQPVQITTKAYRISAIQCAVLDTWTGEAIRLQPMGAVRARIILIPDAGQQPEVWAGLQTGEGQGLAAQLAASGFDVVIPVLVNRDCEYSGNPAINRFTNFPHREWIYRQAYEAGRHVIGYELQQIFSIIDWFDDLDRLENKALPVGIAGYGEGGLLALYAAALDTRISASLVSGYFQNRNELWKEPIYRNISGLLKMSGDAAIAVMCWPRTVIIDATAGPELKGPPPATKQRTGASPGILRSPAVSVVKEEYDKAVSLIPPGKVHLQWCPPGSGDIIPFSASSIKAFTNVMRVSLRQEKKGLANHSAWLDVNKRQERIVRSMEQQVQNELLLAERVRNNVFWAQLKRDTTTQRPVKDMLRNQFWQQIGKLRAPSVPANAKARIYEKTNRWTSYEIMLDVWQGVFIWGILVLPNDIKSSEQRPVIVCQHGLEGTPRDVVSTDSTTRFYRFYKGFATRLAERGYITFAPAHLYRGENKYRQLQRKANPLGLTLFSVMIGQHQQILGWLKSLPFVDPQRIGYYGLSYGGKSAMRIPVVLEDYALSICSGDFNEWVLKVATTRYPFSYMYTGEYDMPEWDLAHTFNYAEMAALIAPRPFMVERGHLDAVANSEWVAYEFAKVQRHYDMLGLSDRTCIEYFWGPHTINGVGTFKFIDEHLKKYE